VRAVQARDIKNAERDIQYVVNQCKILKPGEQKHAGVGCYEDGSGDRRF